MIPWFRDHKFKIHLGAFVMMMLASAGLYAAMDAAAGLTWLLLAVFILANLAAMVVK
jgi:hypothetical protein